MGLKDAFSLSVKTVVWSIKNVFFRLVEKKCKKMADVKIKICNFAACFDDKPSIF